MVTKCYGFFKCFGFSDVRFKEYLYVNKTFKQIKSVFPELFHELHFPTWKIKKTLSYVYRHINDPSNYRISKKVTHLAFSISFIDGNAYLEIKRTQEDKNKEGTFNKFSRVIAITDKTVERYIALKVCFSEKASKAERDLLVDKRLDEINRIAQYRLNPEYCVNTPIYSFSYLRQNNSKQALTLWHDFGEQMETAAKNEKWSFRKTLEALIQAGKAIEDIHKNNLLDRDIKTNNFVAKTLKNGNLVVKKIDFGFLIPKEEAENTTLAGTAQYVDPNIRLSIYDLGERKIRHNSESTDCYAFYKTMFVMLEKFIIIEKDHVYVALENNKANPERAKEICKQLKQLEEKIKELRQNMKESSVCRPAQFYFDSAEYDIAFTKLLKLLAEANDFIFENKRPVSAQLWALLEELLTIDASMRPSMPIVLAKLEQIEASLPLKTLTS